MIETNGKRESGKSVLAARHDDDDSLWVFHTSVNWWFFTGVWVTASLLRSPGLFLVFWPTSTMLLFRWSLLVLRFPTPPGLLLNLWGSFQVHQLQLVSPSPSCSIVYLGVRKDVSISLFFRFLLIFTLGSAGVAKSSLRQVLFFLLTVTRSGLLVEINWSVWISLCDSFQDGFWFMHIPSGRMVKSKFLAQFPVDHFSYPVISSLVVFLC